MAINMYTKASSHCDILSRCDIFGRMSVYVTSVVLRVSTAHSVRTTSDTDTI